MMDQSSSTTRDAKFRQAAFVYLHVAVLYEATAWAMFGRGMLPDRLGGPIVWLVLGAVVGLAIFFALLRWRTPWLPRVLWLFNVARLSYMIDNAFFDPQARAPSGLYVMAIVVLVINAWMLARAGWDL